MQVTEKYKVHSWTHSDTWSRWQSNTLLEEAAPNTTISKVCTGNVYNTSSFSTTFLRQESFDTSRTMHFDSPRHKCLRFLFIRSDRCSQGRFHGEYRIQVKCVSVCARVSFTHCFLHLQQKRDHNFHGKLTLSLFLRLKWNRNFWFFTV